MFVDQVRVRLRAGDGGAGVASFARSKGKPRGKPVGGSGGHGGDVVVEADDRVATLLSLSRNPHHRAGSGTHGEGDLRHGRNGDDLVVSVPPGTSVYDDDGVLVADLVRSGQRVVVLRGGRGGRGNAAFLSPRMRNPSICEQGEYGREAWFTLELKLLADAALIGFPNAGKSTLISRVSAAKPKIADYPFTTLEPNLGVVEVDGRQFVLADIPGLIEGAADGRGLGHEFLRHVLRARVLVVLLDPSPWVEHPPEAQLEILIGELGAFEPELLERPRVLVVGKSDLGDARTGTVADAFEISAITGEGLRPLLHHLADVVERAERRAPDRQGFVLHRPVVESFEVHRTDDGWLVEGVDAVRAVRFADLTNPQAGDLAARRLARLGVDDALAAAGAQPGDTVTIGELEFEWVPDDRLAGGFAGEEEE